VGQIVSGVRVSASFEIIFHLVRRLGLVVQVNVSFQSFALRMFVPSCFCHTVCHPLCQKGQFSVPPVLSCFRRPHNGAVACFLQTRLAHMLHFCAPQTHFTTKNSLSVPRRYFVNSAPILENNRVGVIYGMLRGLVICELQTAKWRTGKMRTWSANRRYNAN